MVLLLIHVIVLIIIIQMVVFLTLVWGNTVGNKSKVSIRGKCNEKIFNPSTVIASFGKG